MYRRVPRTKRCRRCAVLLTSEPVTIHNIPDIVDVNKLIDLLRQMGVKVEKLGTGSYRFTAKEVDLEFFLDPKYKALGGSLRGSVMVAGPALARFGRGYIPSPGGDKIGPRPHGRALHRVREARRRPSVQRERWFLPRGGQEA